MADNAKRIDIENLEQTIVHLMLVPSKNIALVVPYSSIATYHDATNCPEM